MQHEISACGWKLKRILVDNKMQVQEKFPDHQSILQKMRLDAYINTCNHQSNTEPTTPNLTERRPRTNPQVWFLWLLRVGFKSAMADPEIKTQADPWADPEWTEKADLFQKQTLKSLSNVFPRLCIWITQGAGLQVVRKKTILLHTSMGERTTRADPGQLTGSALMLGCVWLELYSLSVVSSIFDNGEMNYWTICLSSFDYHLNKETLIVFS